MNESHKNNIERTEHKNNILHFSVYKVQEAKLIYDFRNQKGVSLGRRKRRGKKGGRPRNAG